MSASNPGVGQNLCGGKWVDAAETMDIVDPLNGGCMLKVPNTSMDEIAPFCDNMANVPRTGLHNPIKNPERYNMLGRVMADGARELAKPEVQSFFADLIQRVVPKSSPQCAGEPNVVKKWMESYSTDQVRYLARSFGVPGDQMGQTSTGIRMPFGGVSVITPFNFPLEIPALQTMSALFMGNQCTTKVDEKVQIVFEQYLRMLHFVGLPMTDIDMIYSSGPVMNELCVKGKSRMCLFTGSQHIADKLTIDLLGRVKLEDAGFDWKILGPDVADVDFVTWQADQDAYAFSGQKCSAQSILFIHENWAAPEVDIVQKLKDQAAKRSLKDLTCSPVLTWSTDKIQAHVDMMMQIPGAKLEFGGRAIAEEHSIPAQYGAYEPTAVSVPLSVLVENPEHFATASTELFGPFQVFVTYGEGDVDKVLALLNSLDNHLTAGVVSNDIHFIQNILAQTVNGTTYAGIRAKTTAAPQQHCFGPSGDPRSAGIHTPEAIKLCWSSHREIIYDHGPVAADWVGVQS